MNNWPADADGDVLRILEERDFDFDKTHNIEFYIEFNNWPLTDKQQREITENLPSASFLDSDQESIADGDAPGYVLYTANNIVTHEFVGQEQARLSRLVEHLNGVCNSWAVCSPCS
ncbi:MULTISPECIES: ribonuclease E inhibitor RraB [Pseudoalteromonas]|uniref:Ribonuclease E inhibitor RraB n=1 Tax=Pseudoalteromonas obscura TaxID=3048491 RepID=A0ABT7ENV5_9GAMM|nr:MULTISPECIES: ribonuclease E inhibitor RraB [Pseudoalteromonas]MBQ4838096.1 ribonuclease E inhibitor RraB [Pseudoalteromonas luteoviolacea]MDK2596732.1 ribonuclease E inhibitor RraB [Pseudoalteromonas sp. P94(2023)]